MECSICLNSLSEEEGKPPSTSLPRPKRQRTELATSSAGQGPQLNSTPCGHIFHRVCIIEWFQTGSKECPICTKPMTTQSQLKPVYLPMTSSQVSCKSYDKLKGKLEAVKKEKAAFLQELDILKEAKEKADLQFAKEKKEKEALQVILHETPSEKKQRLEVENRKLIQPVGKLVKEKTELQKSLEQLKQCHNALIYDYDVVTIKGQQDEEKIKELEGKVLEERSTAEDAVDKLNELQDRHDLLGLKIDEKTAKNGRDQEMISNLERKISSLTNSLTDCRRRGRHHDHGNPSANGARSRRNYNDGGNMGGGQGGGYGGVYGIYVGGQGGGGGGIHGGGGGGGQDGDGQGGGGGNIYFLKNK